MFTQDIRDEVDRTGLITLTRDYYNFDDEQWETHCDSRTDEQDEQDTLIQEILAIESSYFILRRVPGIPGESIDALWSVRRKIIDEYEKKYGEYKDVNETVDF